MITNYSRDYHLSGLLPYRRGVTCLRCGGPVRHSDVGERLCSDNGCFMVFILTLVLLKLTLPPLRDLNAEWWTEAYRLVAKEGRAELPPVGWRP